MTDPERGISPDLQSGPPAVADQVGRSKRPDTPLRLAWGVAIAADMIQWVFPVAFALGPFAAADVALDVVVMIVMTRLLGWHWAFAPAFAVELLPFVDFVPTWTMAVWIATRRRIPPARMSG